MKMMYLRPVLFAGFAAALSIVASARAEATLARIDGLPDAPAFDLAREAVGVTERAPETAMQARRDARLAAQRVEAALRAEGYYGARIDAAAEEGTPPRAVVTVDPGPRFAIAGVAVEIDGDDDIEIAENARAAAGLEAGAAARAEDVMAAERRVLIALREAGFPDAFAGPRDVTVDHSRQAMDVALRFETGERARLGAVRSAGPAEVRTGFLERLAPYETGEVYAPETLGEYARRLRATRAFSSVGVEMGEADADGLRPVLVSLGDAPRRSLSLGGSYSTSEGGGVEGAWSLRNAFSGGERLTIEARLQTIERALTAELAIPAWRLPQRTLLLSAGALQEETNAFDSTSLSVGVEAAQPFFSRWTAALGLGLSLQETVEDDLTRRFVLARGAASANWDATDDALNPTRGARLRFGLQPVFGAGDAASAYLISDAEARVYRGLDAHRFVFAARARAGAITTTGVDDTPVDDLFFAGGGGSVRGFEYQALSPRDADGELEGGRSVVETSVELRARVGERLGGVVFVDGGAASRSAAPSIDELRWGAGVGLRYFTDFGPLRVDLATPLDPIEGDPDVQLYFSIGQAF